MRRRIALRWLPLALFVLLATTGVLLCAAESSGPGVLLVGTLDGYQLGVLLIVLATGTAVVALIQAAVLAGALKRPAWCLLIRLVAGLLIAVAVPFGHLLIVVTVFSTVGALRPPSWPMKPVEVRWLSTPNVAMLWQLAQLSDLSAESAFSWKSARPNSTCALAPALAALSGWNEALACLSSGSSAEKAIS